MLRHKWNLRTQTIVLFYWLCTNILELCPYLDKYGSKAHVILFSVIKKPMTYIAASPAVPASSKGQEQILR